MIADEECTRHLDLRDRSDGSCEFRSFCNLRTKKSVAKRRFISGILNTGEASCLNDIVKCTHERWPTPVYTSEKELEKYHIETDEDLQLGNYSYTMQNQKVPSRISLDLVRAFTQSCHDGMDTEELRVKREEEQEKNHIETDEKLRLGNPISLCPSHRPNSYTMQNQLDPNEISLGRVRTFTQSCRDDMDTHREELRVKRKEEQGKNQMKTDEKLERPIYCGLSRSARSDTHTTKKQKKYIPFLELSDSQDDRKGTGFLSSSKGFADRNDGMKCRETSRTIVEHSAVIVVDIGATYSGYSFRSTSDFAKDPLNNRLFWSRKDHKMHGKTASSLLLNPDKSFNSFGFTAEEEYSKMWQEHQNGEFKNEKYPDNKTPSDWFFFRHFKMNMYGKKDCDNDTTIKDETGNKELPIKTVIKESIGYLKEHAIDFCCLNENDVLWVLTLPAIWSESQKEMMRSAAIEAGIHRESLITVLESEAAALLSMEQELNRQEKNGIVELLPFASPSKLLMIDLGGGTVDTTILQVPSNRSSEKLYNSVSWNLGGNKVNDAFMQIWAEILEKDYTRCMGSFPNEVLDLWQDFEVQKRSIGESFGKEYLCVPVPEFCHEIKHFKEKFENSAKYPGIKVNRGKVEFPNRLIENLFMTTIQEIICRVGGLLKKISVDAIILVGGFSESKFVYQSMKDAFKNVPILKPHEGSLSVLKGALLYGSQF